MNQPPSGAALVACFAPPHPLRQAQPFRVVAVAGPLPRNGLGDVDTSRLPAPTPANSRGGSGAGGASQFAAARALVYRAAWLKDQGRPFAHEAAIAKLYTGEASNRAVDEAIQIHGGYGYMNEYPISRIYRDQKVLEIGEGTNEVQRLVIARGLGL